MRIWLICLLAGVAFVLVGSLMPGSYKWAILHRFPNGLHLDKVGHVLGFAAIAFVLIRSGLVYWFGTVLLALCLALVSEGLQFFVGGRVPLLFDVAIDLAGAGAGMAAALSLKR
jgi:hypothetical protein